MCACQWACMRAIVHACGCICGCVHACVHAWLFAKGEWPGLDCALRMGQAQAERPCMRAHKLTRVRVCMHVCMPAYVRTCVDARERGWTVRAKGGGRAGGQASRGCMHEGEAG